jgi:hypothetical protein
MRSVFFRDVHNVSLIVRGTIVAIYPDNTYDILVGDRLHKKVPHRNILPALQTPSPSSSFVIQDKVEVVEQMQQEETKSSKKSSKSKKEEED